MNSESVHTGWRLGSEFSVRYKHLDLSAPNTSVPNKVLGDLHEQFHPLFTYFSSVTCPVLCINHVSIEG